MSALGSGTTSCPYCQSGVQDEDEPRSCAGCQTPHHADCWEEAGGCAVLGCAGVPSGAGQTGSSGARSAVVADPAPHALSTRLRAPVREVPAPLLPAPRTPDPSRSVPSGSSPARTAPLPAPPPARSTGEPRREGLEFASALREVAEAVATRTPLRGLVRGQRALKVVLAGGALLLVVLVTAGLTQQGALSWLVGDVYAKADVDAAARNAAATARAEGYESGEAAGLLTGRREGRAQGRSDGYAEGRADGRAEAKAEAQGEYDRGYAAGRSDAESENALEVSSARSEGYSDGYSDGLSSAPRYSAPVVEPYDTCDYVDYC